MKTPTTSLAHTRVFMAFPDQLARIRRDKGLMQKELAEIVGLHQSQIHRYESAASQPTLDALRKLALALGVTTDELVFEADERSARPCQLSGGPHLVHATWHFTVYEPFDRRCLLHRFQEPYGLCCVGIDTSRDGVTDVHPKHSKIDGARLCPISPEDEDRSTHISIGRKPIAVGSGHPMRAVSIAAASAA